LRPFQFAALAFLCFTPATADPLISPVATARPVVAKHGMIVSQEAAASRLGLDILKRGGNAIDAAVAVGFALAVTLPRAGNLGGGGFMLIYRADLNRTIAIDYRETAPVATTRDVFLDANGEADPFKSRYSGLAIGVPGTVAGLELAWRKYGSGKFTLTARERRSKESWGPRRYSRCGARVLPGSFRLLQGRAPRAKSSFSRSTPGP
jgi:gamma-glutamyltranspeptidase/glutathione hydrolase